MAVKTKDILEGSIPKQLTLLFFPVYFGFLCQQIYNAFNAIIVGQYVGKQALAAVGGSTSIVISLLVNFVIGLSAGTTIIMARHYARKDFENIKKCVKTGFFIAIVFGTIVTIIGIVFSKPMLVLMNVPEDVLDYSLIYMRIYFLGMIPNFIYNIGASLLRAIGDTKRPTYFIVVSCITNIIFGFVFVRIFNLGVVGVGISSVISQTISAILILLIFYKTPEAYSYSLKEFGYDKEILKNTLEIGLPSGLQSVLYSISNIYIQSTINTFGTDTIAAYTAFSKIEAFYWDFESAFSIAILTMAAQNFGAHKIDRVKKIAFYSMMMYFGVTVAFSIFDYIMSPILVGIFCEDSNVVMIGIKICRLLACFYWLYSFIEGFATVIKAVGHSLQSMIISAFGICAIRIGYLMLFNYNSVLEVLYCFPISWAITALIYGIYFLSGRWIINE